MWHFRVGRFINGTHYRLFSSPRSKTCKIPRNNYLLSNNKISAILADGAGTTFDPGCNSLVQFFKEIFSKKLEKEISDELARLPMGCSKSEHFRFIMNRLNISEERQEKLIPACMEEFTAGFSKSVAGADLVPGLKSTIGFLEQMGCRLGINSSYPKSVLQEVFKQHKLGLPYVTPDDVERGRPYPDMLQSLSQRLNLPLSRCIAVGDTPDDVLAAKNAGIWSVVVCKTSVFAGEDNGNHNALQNVVNRLLISNALPDMVVPDFSYMPDVCLFLSYLEHFLGLKLGNGIFCILGSQGALIHSDRDFLNVEISDSLIDLSENEMLQVPHQVKLT